MAMIFPSFTRVFEAVCGCCMPMTVFFFFAGTGAFHSQVTRSGKKTLMGQLHDGKLSLFRLYLNYHDDPVKQDALYLLLNGRYPPPPQSPQPSSLSIQSTIAATARAFRYFPSNYPELLFRCSLREAGP